MNFVSILSASVLGRLVINSLRRVPYAIMTDLAAALGIPRETLAAAVAVQSSMGFASPLLGPFIDRSRRKQIMLLALGIFILITATGAAVSWLGLSVTIVLAVLVIAGLCKILYDPAMLAYVSTHTPASRRGFAIGISETAWAMSLVIFAPLAAFLLVNANVGSIFAVICACGVAAFVLVWRLLPDDPAPVNVVTVKNNWNVLFSQRSAVMLILGIACHSLASEIMSIGYEKWFKDTFLLSVGALGTLALYISAAEFGGELLVAGLADRLGRRRLTLLMLTSSALFCLLLPLMGLSLPFAIVALVGLYISFETSVVAIISLSMDVLPEARGMLITGVIGVSAGTRVLGTLVGSTLLTTSGFALSGIVSTVIFILAVVIIWRFVPEINSHAAPLERNV
ncbi:MAG: MFS transporter [Anaerolineae bacterium]|nr:MFS transporter [Anaerolineae bacterium]